MGQLIIRYKKGNPERKEVKIDISSNEKTLEEEEEIEEVLINGQLFRKVEEEG